ncbi:23S rRNA U2552 (ribose-2'-O)-methylase RlmE/FtsJ [Croceifilum oryzae]|uniref:23S rRNA U2552 (Ribose-2'-O)-methylase RlmE/FtsJ n=1 Tax=Croceifilum oryzae TaxID=1553429 RepID=A0AAJ1WSN3_9BACL|nr:23S rRNA U2552 (ribose-2'-O)-methylase RlmE/FtsJ [Croceifilum oryzae]
MNKSEKVKEVYRAILHAIDTKEIDAEEDILVIRRDFFEQEQDQAIETFANTWFVDKEELHLSAKLYEMGADPIPNIKKIFESREFHKYKAVHPEAIPVKYGPEMKRQWRKVLDEVIVPLVDELR